MNLTESLIHDIEDFTLSEIRVFAETLYNSSLQLFRLLENLLNWTKSQTGRLQVRLLEYDLHEIVQENIELVRKNAENKSIIIVTSVPENTILKLDLNIINTVLRNLITNAIKFTHLGGKIKIELDNSKEGSVLLIVEDNGIGIPDEKITKLFHIGETESTVGTNYEQGTGLGLILSKELVQKLGGDLWVESKIGYGSRFILSIPTTEQIKS